MKEKITNAWKYVKENYKPMLIGGIIGIVIANAAQDRHIIFSIHI